MKKGRTKSGFPFELDENVLDDMRLLDLMAVSLDEDASDADKIVATSKTVEMVLGKAQKARLYEHLANLNDGRVPVKSVQDALAEVMAAAGEKTEKN